MAQTTLFRFILSRLLQMLVVLLGTVTVLFVVLYLLVPGDTALAILGSKATPQNLENLRHQMGLDRPVMEQFLQYLWHLAHFDFGQSYVQGRSVSAIIRDYLPATAYLAGAALLIEAAVGIGWGMLMSLKRSRRLGAVSALGSALLLAMPVFLLGLLLQYVFGSQLRLLPLSGLGGYNPLNVLLPAVSLAAAQAVIVASVMRASLQDEMRRPYMLAARARGLTRRQALMRHGARNAIGPVATLLAIDLGTLLGGAMVTEIVFSWPGTGRMVYFAAEQRDLPLIVGSVIVLVTIFVAVNSAIDILYGIIDPTVRLARLRGGGEAIAGESLG